MFRIVLAVLGGLLGLLVLLTLLVVAVGWATTGPRHVGPKTDHWDGERFQNRAPRAGGGFARFLKWQATRQRPEWRLRETAPGPPPPARVGAGEMRVTFVNHATVLVQMDGVNILTDPTWAKRASPFSWIGPRRYHSPGLRLEDLPPIDAVLVSHNHYDHLDLESLARLGRLHRPKIFVGLGNAALLARAGIAGAIELDWWQAAKVGAVEVIGVPAQHFANRGLFDRDRTLWMGFAIRGPAGLAYFAGDTGAGPHFAEIRARLGPPRLAILPIGAFQPRWFMAPVHIDPEEALAAQETLGAGTALGMHFGTFKLADDGQDEPPEALAAAIARRGPAAPRFWILAFGEGRAVP